MSKAEVTQLHILVLIHQPTPQTKLAEAWAPISTSAGHDTLFSYSNLSLPSPANAHEEYNVGHVHVLWLQVTMADRWRLMMEFTEALRNLQRPLDTTRVIDQERSACRHIPLGIGSGGGLRIDTIVQAATYTQIHRRATM
jgi:hypothetical protein